MTILLTLFLALGCCAAEETKNERNAIGPTPSTKHVTLTDYAEYKDGADWAPAFVKAFADCEFVYVPPGHYSCSEIELASNTTIQGAGETTVFVPLSDHLFIIEGKIGPEIRIAADISDFSNTIFLERSDDFAAGDEIMIRGQRNSMLREGIPEVNYRTDWVLGRTRKSSCFFGEMDVVTSASGNQITTENNRIFPDYFKDDSREPSGIGEGFLFRKATTVSKLTLVKNASLRHFAITGTSKCFMPVKLTYCKDCLVENITFKTSTESYKKNGVPDLSLVYCLYVWNTKIKNFKAILSPDLLAELDAKEKTYAHFSNYNLFKMISSTGSGFENCEANGGTHAFSITRSASPKGRGGIPSVNCYIRDCTSSNCIWSGVTVQQACYITELSGNTVTACGQGIITGGRNTAIVNNTVNTDYPYSSDYYYTSIDRGGTVGIGIIEGAACGSVVRDNRIGNFYSGIAMLDGYEKKNCFEEGNILIENNTVADCLRGFTLYKNPHCRTLGRKDLKIVIRNNSFARSGERKIKVGDQETDTCGVYLPDLSTGITVEGNKFNNFSYGIWMDKFVDSIVVRRNAFRNTDCGIALTDISFNSNNHTVRISHPDNTFENTPIETEGLDQQKISSTWVD